ncbi:MAG TPA: LamG domain-containing protein [Chthoniobacteraceae bacterium]|nr:LamG domain-containing protein [Chthoniobacteraceae bacterium]
MNPFLPIVVGLTGLIAMTARADEALRSALLMYTSFDGKLDADVAAGDAKLYTAETGDRKEAKAGLPEGGLVLHEDGALRFTKKMKPVVFFRGEENLGYQVKDWTGSLSVWLKLDPDKDLEPGYCDPLQFVAQGWGDGNMFIEFSKDHTPRHFRYAIQPVTKHWNPTGAQWEAIPEPERPMVAVQKPPFTSDRWTHVVFSFGNVNSGKKDGWGRLYLNGELQGEFKNLDATFKWDVAQSALTLGLSYVGLLDDLAVFNRPLTDAEVKAIHASPRAIGPLLKAGKAR